MGLFPTTEKVVKRTQSSFQNHLGPLATSKHGELKRATASFLGAVTA